MIGSYYLMKGIQCVGELHLKTSFMRSRCRNEELEAIYVMLSQLSYLYPHPLLYRLISFL
jgi:hypothetical protein